VEVGGVSWIYLDDKFHSNPKVRAADLDGSGLYARALAFCGDHLTDGVVNTASMVQLAEHRKRPIQKCLDAGLFVTLESGYFIPDYLEHNPSRAEVLAVREQKSEAGKKGARNRWRKYAETHSEPMAPAIAPVVAEGMANGWQNDGSRAGESPTPTPTPEVQELSASKEASPEISVMRHVLIYANEHLGHHWKLTKDRQTKIRARLREGYTEQQLCSVIDGVLLDPWDERRVGGHDDLTVVFRSAAQVDKFLELAAGTNGHDPDLERQARGEAQMAAARQRAAEAQARREHAGAQ
jgi:uncharacterized phage protein (TIGR02220 family)